MPALVRSSRAIERAWLGTIAQAYATTAVIFLLLPAARVDLTRRLTEGWIRWDVRAGIIAAALAAVSAAGERDRRRRDIAGPSGMGRAGARLGAPPRTGR
jgi:hypothetical protein